MLSSGTNWIVIDEFRHASTSQDLFYILDTPQTYSTYPCLYESNAGTETQWRHCVIPALLSAKFYYKSMRHWTGPSLVQIMACRLFDVKPLTKLLICHHQSHPKKWNSVKNIEIKQFPLVNLCVKLPSLSFTPFCPGVRSLSGFSTADTTMVSNQSRFR